MSQRQSLGSITSYWGRRGRFWRNTYHQTDHATSTEKSKKKKKKKPTKPFPTTFNTLFFTTSLPLHQATILNTQFAYFSASQDYCGQPLQGRFLLRLDLKRNLQFIWICFLEKLFLFFCYHYT